MILKRNYIIFILLLIIPAWACSPTRYLKKNEYLLGSMAINCDNKLLDTYDMESYIKQKPNKRALGIRLYARIYNLVNPAGDEARQKKYDERLSKKNERQKERYHSKATPYKYRADRYRREADTTTNPQKKQNLLKRAEIDDKKYKANIQRGNEGVEKVFSLSNWIREIGEAPVILKKEATNHSAQQLKLYMRNKGYYDAKVITRQDTSGKKISLTYNITCNNPILIDSFKYNVNDIGLLAMLDSSARYSLIKKGNPLDVDVLQAERDRITRFLKNNGYFKFSKEYIFYNIDTLSGREKTKVILGIKPALTADNKPEKHKVYLINRIYIFPDHDPAAYLEDPDYYYDDTDTSLVVYNQYIPFYFIKKKESIVKPSTIGREIYIYPDSLFNQTNFEDTYKHLTSMKIFKLVNIQFKEPDSLHSNMLDCNIQLTTANQQSYAIELEGTNSSGNIGAAGNFIYQHKNIFHGAETFDFRFKTALETQKNVINEDDKKGFNTQEYGVEMKLQFPRLVSPIYYDRFSKRYNPKTTISIGFNYQDRPDYTRTIANMSIGYYWKSTEFLTNSFTPLEFSSITINNDSAFQESIRNLYIKDSYEDHFIVSANYAAIYNNQSIKRRNFTYIRFFIESAGNVLNGIMTASKEPKTDGSYQMPLFGTVFAQYLKSDIDWRYYLILNDKNKIVWRLFAGAGYPYGNLNVLPFGKRYFSGGANSIRAWQVRSLGPGSYVPESGQGFPNRTADIKLEGNFEYRFKLFWMIEGAIFVDAGNIWAINKFDNRPGARFALDRFYKEIAVGTGFGTRLDFSFFIFRFDFGLKLRDPELPENNRIIFKTRKFNYNDWTLNLGIGYPF